MLNERKGTKYTCLCRTMDAYRLRIIVNETDIKKVSINRRPETLEELKIKVTEKCQLQHDFKLLYEDTEFPNSISPLQQP